MDTVVLRPEKKVYSAAEAAEVLGISRSRVYELARSEGFPAFNIGKRIVISIKGLEHWIDQQTGFQETEDNYEQK